MSDPCPIRAEIARSRRDVLDLTLRNPLLNFRTSKRRGIEVVDERSRELFRILVGGFTAGSSSSAAPKAMRFIPALEGDADPGSGQLDLGDDAPAELVAMMSENDEPDDATTRHTDTKLQTALTRAQLGLRLRETFRHARLSIEEQGVNILYLALGMLVWHESESSDIERRAPLILIPVRLEEMGANRTFRLKWTGDEVEANLSLERKIRQDFGIRLPEMPTDEDLDVDSYLAKVEEAVAPKDRWTVAPDEVHLSFFSFSKLLIYKDLDPEAWPEEKSPDQHTLVRKLFGSEGFAGEAPDTGAGHHIDTDEGVAALHPVVDADSSQTLAVLDAIRGRNLVIQGPPGTGKSQTITNLIAEALACGRTVLFVAEKMAALEVVKRRLDTLHLGGACLELHSHKSNKRDVLNELRRTLGMGRPKVPYADEDKTLLEDAREQLNDYARAVNSPVGDSGLTPHNLVGRMARIRDDGLSVDGPILPLPDSASWNREEFVRRREIARAFQALVGKMGVPCRQVWWPYGRVHILPSEEQHMREGVRAARDALDVLRRCTDELIARIGSDETFGQRTPEGARRIIRTTRRALEAPDLAGADHRRPEWTTRSERITELASTSRSFAALRRRHEDVLIPEAWDADVLAERQALRAHGHKWWRFLSGAYRAARSTLVGLCRGDVPGTAGEQLELLDAILESKRLLRKSQDGRDLTSRLFPALELGDQPGRHQSFARAAEWLVELRQSEAQGQVSGEVHDLLDRLQENDRESAAPPNDRTSLVDGAQALEDALNALTKSLDALELRTDRMPPGDELGVRPYGALAAWLQDALANIPSIQGMVRFNQLEQDAARMGIPSVAVAAASQPDANHRLAALFEYACYSAWLEKAFREQEALARFEGATHGSVIDRFCELDMAQFHHNQALIAERHWRGLPSQHGGGQMGVLLREFQKKRRHMPVRRLLQEAGHAIQAIKPVFMMSPLSIAKYLPPGSVTFDMVVFDEASQVRPVDALGAILRGNQAIVVGDSKQLPPTSFFDRMGDDETEEASHTSDLESILGLFCSRGAPERMLRWHYRSRHESLITVSNHEFYDDRLVVFPSPDAGKTDTGLIFNHLPDAIYQRRGINTDEAQAVAEAVLAHAGEAPGRTLGVAAFSSVQARRIEDEVEILRRRNPVHEAFFTDHPAEPFFVKNLENVQGDERDVIFISIGYGKLDGGYLPMNFGPLNRDGGERRLNVLITRARRRCIVYCNFVGADLDLRRSKARGVQALRTFLEYAERGVIDIPTPTGKAADSPFEEAVAARLRGLGYDVHHQVGSAGFFVDLAVVDPDAPGRYLLGIECDGAAYHSSRSARDRDRLRQQVLEGLGWRIHRVWSTDWFRDPAGEVDRMEQALGSAKLGQATRSTPKPAPKPLERAAPRPRISPSAPPYAIARPDLGNLHTPLHEVPPVRIAEWMAQVVEVESPVHLDDVMDRIRGATDVRRFGSRIQQQMRAGARVGQTRGLFRMDDARILWRTDQESIQVRHRGDGAPRDANRIASEEISEALIQTIRASYGIAPADARTRAIRLLGFKKSGPKIQARFQNILEEMVEAGTILAEGSLLRVPAPPEPGLAS